MIVVTVNIYFFILYVWWNVIGIISLKWMEIELDPF